MQALIYYTTIFLKHLFVNSLISINFTSMKREIFYFYIIKSSSNIIPAIGLHNYILQGNATCMLWSGIDFVKCQSMCGTRQNPCQRWRNSGIKRVIRYRSWVCVRYLTCLYHLVCYSLMPGSRQSWYTLSSHLQTKLFSFLIIALCKKGPKNLWWKLFTYNQYPPYHLH